MKKSVSVTIALDAMGGDYGPDVVIPGANLSLLRHPETHFLLFGDEKKIKTALEAYPNLTAHCDVIHTDVSVPMDAKPSQALRQGRHGSSMWQAIKAVKDGSADAVVSAGNTGALMAMAKVGLKMLPGIERPALAAIWPTVKSECIVLDVGANVRASANQLFDFALMGVAMARTIFNFETPSVGLLNVGVEEIKGLEEIKKASNLLKNSELPIEYYGFIEGTDIGLGTVDVVVSEGFSGNIALKTAEGTAKQAVAYLKAAMNRSVLTRMGAFLAQTGFAELKQKMDPRHNNGGPFLGVNGIAIKSHGGTDATGFACAIDLAFDLAQKNILEKIIEDVKIFHNNLNDSAIQKEKLSAYP
ncbi:MAG: phosphate acyltransferase PlsX [Pseudomonadota bacterium]